MTEVVCLGESMVTFVPSQPGRLADVPSFTRAIGGAESNVACALAAVGHRVKWVSRVGADGFGDHLVEAIASHGVDTSAVRRDPTRPTGVYFRTADDRASGSHEVAYYRAGSAASAMSTATVPLVSFDVNHRPRLWGNGADPRVLLDLARGADLVFVGEDEAAEAWDLHGVAAIRAALPEPTTLIVKRGADGATLLTRDAEHTDPDRGDTAVTVPALRVDVVAPVGAGDAFAAGVLSATLRGLPPDARLRHGHLAAAAALCVAADTCVPPPRALADRLAGIDDERWAALRLSAGWPNALQQSSESTLFEEKR